jgi:hypothetical protein
MIEINEVTIVTFAIIIFIVGYVVYTALNEVEEVGYCNDNWKERIAMCEGKYMGKVLWTSQGEYCQTNNYTYKIC